MLILLDVGWENTPNAERIIYGWRNTRFVNDIYIYISKYIVYVGYKHRHSPTIVRWIFQIAKDTFLQFVSNRARAYSATYELCAVWHSVCVCVSVWRYGHAMAGCCRRDGMSQTHKHTRNPYIFLRTYPHFESIAAGGLFSTLTLIQFTLRGATLLCAQTKTYAQRAHTHTQTSTLCHWFRFVKRVCLLESWLRQLLLPSSFDVARHTIYPMCAGILDLNDQSRKIRPSSLPATFADFYLFFFFFLLRCDSHTNTRAKYIWYILFTL